MFIIISRLVFPDGVYMSSAFWSAETHLDSQGNINTALGEASQDSPHCFSFSTKDIDWKLIIPFAILITSILVPKPLIFLYALLLSIPAIVAFIALLPSITKLLFRERTTTARYHTALHQVTNAYQTLKRVPTLEEAKKHSIFLKDCCIHTNFQAILKQLPTILLAFFFNGSLASLLALFIFYFSWEILVYPKVKDMKFMYCLDRFILAKPTDKELKVVLECLNSLMDIPYNGFQNIYHG